MGILATAAATTKPAKPCVFGALLAEHADPDDLATINDNRINSADIARIAAKHWGRVSVHTVRRHRRRECPCYGTETN